MHSILLRIRISNNLEYVMRRCSDDWINASHILKVAGLDKYTRTSYLVVHKGVHEKVQGGHGKYQGIWPGWRFRETC